MRAGRDGVRDGRKGVRYGRRSVLDVLGWSAPDLNMRGRDQRFMLWPSPNLLMGGRRPAVPLTDLGAARFRPWREADCTPPKSAR